jgi:cytosine/uracil/thiamine/allantoin permease
METDIIWILLFIGYAIGLIPIAILGIMGTNEAIDFQNRMRKQERKNNAQ